MEEAIAELYAQLEASLDELLRVRGYTLNGRESSREAFGSRFSVWDKPPAKHRYRLIWDGKDAWFVLEALSYSGNPENAAWAEVVTVPIVAQANDPAYRAEVISRIRQPLLDADYEGRTNTAPAPRR